MIPKYKVLLLHVIWQKQEILLLSWVSQDEFRDRISSAASLHRFCSAPFMHCAVLGWRPFKTAHGTIMSHQGQRGWGRFPSSTIITVSRTFWRRKCTRIPVLVFTLPLHPCTEQSCGPTTIGKETLYVSCYLAGGGLTLIYQSNVVLCLAVGLKQSCCQFRSTVWALYPQPLTGPIGEALPHHTVLLGGPRLGYNRT